MLCILADFSWLLAAELGAALFAAAQPSAFLPCPASALFEGMPPSTDAAAKLMERIWSMS
jgi:hypothetical protein